MGRGRLIVPQLWRLKSKCGRAGPPGLSPGLVDGAFSPCPHRVVPVPVCVLMASASKDTRPSGSGPPHRPHSTLSTAVRPCLQVQPHSEVLGAGAAPQERSHSATVMVLSDATPQD